MTEESRNIRVIMEYDGTRYLGWQRQAKGDTIQSLVEDRLRIMTGETLNVVGSGRTDAGVHALHQVCNFLTRTRMDTEDLRRGLNSLLPDDIYIKSAERVPLDFHSRYDARSKTYEYRIWNQRARNIFLRNFTWHIREPLNLEDMERSIRMLIGKHDFSSFRSSGSGNRDPFREMIGCDMAGPDNGLLRFTFEAEGFLRHMVRNIMGTLVDVGRGKMNSDDFKRIFLSKDRCKAGIKAPPQGLFLKMVRY